MGMSSHLGGLATLERNPELAPDQEVDSTFDMAPGSIVGVEQTVPKGTAELPEQGEADYGPNNEKLPKILRDALLEVCKLCSEEDQKARLREVARVQKGKSFWKELQYLVYDHETEEYKYPFESAGGMPIEGSGSGEDPMEQPDYLWTRNYYQAKGIIIVSVLSQNVPAVIMSPENWDEEDDRTFAEEANHIVDLIERNNDAQDLLAQTAYHYYTGGKVGMYVRFVTDGQRFKYTDVPEMGSRPVKISEDGYKCLQCGLSTPATQFQGMCGSCGSEVPDDSFQAGETVDVPVIQQVHKMPNGQEVIDVVDALQLKTPMWANKQHEFPYIKWSFEAHVARLRATYPHVADKIKSGERTGGEGGSTFDVQARLQVQMGGPGYTGNAAASLSNLTTYDQYWLRPWAFYLLEETEEERTKAEDTGEKTRRQQLLDLFPMGAYCAWVGSTYCASRNEAMDDCWRISHALPGDGQDRAGLGSSYISPQEQSNVLLNFAFESVEHGVPARFVNSKFIDKNTYGKTVAEPGSTTFITVPGQAKASDGFFETEATQMDVNVMPMLEELAGNVASEMTGAMPALQGEDSGNDTASGQQMQRDQALGRLGLTWREMKRLWLDVMLLAVECFRRNRTDDALAQVTGDSGEMISRVIELGKLRGNIVATAATDEQIPYSHSQKRNVLMALMQSQDPRIQAVLGHPDNAAYIKGLIGLMDLVDPEDESAKKQHREIAEMMKPGQEPQEAMGPLGQPVVKSSVPVDAESEDHTTEAAVCKRWLNTPRGQQVKQSNQMAWLNVRAHLLEHEQAMADAMMAQAQAQMAMQPQPSSDRAIGPSSQGKATSKPPKSAGVPGQSSAAMG